jgi:hypothetical protein
MPSTSLTPAYFSGSSVTTTIFTAPSARIDCAICDHRMALGPLADLLAAGHRHGVVVEDLVGDVDAGGDALADRQQAAVEIGAVAQVGEHVLVGREGLLADPGHALAAHLREADVLRSIQMDMKWQPMPAMAREPSGTLVLVLCGQPEQNQGWRSAPGAATGLQHLHRARSLASRMASCASMRARMSASTPASSGAGRWPRDQRRRQVGIGAQQVLAVGLGIDHSPPEKSPSTSRNLP